jgi:predicted transcriptional regulator of viral defense system
MTSLEKLTAIAKEYGGLIETKIAAEHGVSKAMLYKLCKEGKIQRIVKGQYLLPGNLQDELFSLSRRSNKIIFSHETALFLHGISDRTPFEHTITAPTNCAPSAAIKAECKVYYIKPANKKSRLN